MFWTFAFIISGVALIALTVAKRFEMRGSGEHKVFFLRTVSKGDGRVREYYHRTLRFYTEGKHRFAFFATKRLPVKVKMQLAKGWFWVKEKGESRFGNVRNSRSITKPEGMNEFFKTISEIEKGAGEINEPAPLEVRAEEEVINIEVEESGAAAPLAPSTSKAKAPRKKSAAPRKPRVKKIKVAEIEG